MQKACRVSLSLIFLMVSFSNHASQEIYSPFYGHDIRARIGHSRPFIFISTLMLAGILAGKVLTSLPFIHKPLLLRNDVIVPLAAYGSSALLLGGCAILVKQRTSLNSCTLSEMNQVFFDGKMVHFIITIWSLSWLAMIMYNFLYEQHHGTKHSVPLA